VTVLDANLFGRSIGAGDRPQRAVRAKGVGHAPQVVAVCSRFSTTGLP
jgi:hypothetical protein